MNTKLDMNHNRVYHLEDTMIMYGKYNSDTLMDLLEMVHEMYNLNTWKEKIFVGKINNCLKDKLTHIHNEFDLFCRCHFVPNYNKREICQNV